VVFVDTPGLHKPRTQLGRRLNEVARATLREVDAVLFVLDASEPIGRGDAFIAEALAAVRTPVMVALNKIDRIEKGHQLAQIEVTRHLGDFAEIVPMSAKTGEGVDVVIRLVTGAMPPGPMYYPADMITDQPELVLIAELVREKVLELTREEVPHSVAVVVNEIERDEDGTLDVDTIVYVERDSQKGIVIGKGGRVLKEVGTRARREIEALLGEHVFLRLRVKVEKDWQRRSGMIDRFGYAR
jgi:GTP-binding protein Era